MFFATDSESMANRPFNADEPIAYFITWTTYGTWLPGDERGWSRKGDGETSTGRQVVVRNGGIGNEAIAVHTFAKRARHRRAHHRTPL